MTDAEFTAALRTFLASHPVPPATAPDPATLSGWLLGGPDSFNPQGPSTIYKVRPDGTGKVTLGTGLNPSWSADGKQVSFASPGQMGMQLCIVNADGTGKVTLPVSGLIPVFMPDGKRLLYQVLADPSEVGIVTIANPSDAKVLTRTTVGSTTRHGAKVIGSGAASPSPDGKKIIYTSSQSGRNQIWTMDENGANQKQLTFPTDQTAPDANAARYSPNGLLIVCFRGFETEYGNVEVMNADGTGRKKVTTGKDLGLTGRSANCDGPGWFDDTHVLFQSNLALDGATTGLIDPNIAIRTWIVGIDGLGARVLFDPALNYGTRARSP